MRLGAGLFLIVAIAFIIINTKPSGTHAKPIPPLTEEMTKPVREPRPSIRRLLHPAVCTVSNDDLDSVSSHLANGEITQAKQEISALVLNGKARLLDLSEPVTLLWSAGKVARVQPINPTDSGDRYACYVPLNAIE